MKTLQTSNHLLGNKEALKAEWEKNGFFLFENVLDIDALKSLQNKYREVLEEHEMIKPGDETFVYAGGDRPNPFPGRFKLKDMQEWRNFANNPKIKGFFEEAMGEKIEWVPIIEYRAVRPLGKAPADRFQFWHTDGHYNPGLPLVSIWLPMADIDKDVGGLAVLPGLLDRDDLYPKYADPKSSAETITSLPHSHELYDMSKVGTYPFKLGDVIIFDGRTFHSGLHNLSNRFRLSMDMRFVLASDNVPLVGKLIAVDGDSVKIQSQDDGHIEELKVTDDTYFRETVTRLAISDFQKSMPVGTDVIAARENGNLTVMTHLYPPEKTYDDRGPVKSTY